MIAVDRPSPDSWPTCRGERRLCVGGRRRWAVETGADAAMSATVSDGGAADREQPPAARATTREERTANAARAAAIGGTAIGGAAMSHRQGSLDLRAHDRGSGPPIRPPAAGASWRTPPAAVRPPRPRTLEKILPRRSPQHPPKDAVEVAQRHSGDPGPLPSSNDRVVRASCIACDDPGQCGSRHPAAPGPARRCACHAGDRRRQPRHGRRSGTFVVITSRA